ncbi:RNA polymerase sporulation sigma factor SigH [Lachnospiraceae bacterium ZAX-1]
MSSYETMTDEELIACLRNGQQDITDYIINKYKYLVRKRANAMFLIGGDTDDLIQEGMIGLFKAIRDFKEDMETAFYHFADICISRQIYNAVEASQRKKHQPLNSYVSLNADMDENNGISLMDVLASIDNINPEELFIDKENVMAMQQQMDQILSGMEKRVMQYYLQGMNYHQIAEMLGKQPKSIDNALQRIKGKLSNLVIG